MSPKTETDADDDDDDTVDQVTDAEDTPSTQDDAKTEDNASVDPIDERVSSGHRKRALTAPATSGDDESLATAIGQFTVSGGNESQERTAETVAPATNFSAKTYVAAPITTATVTMTGTPAASTVAPPPRPTFVNVVSDLVAAALRPLMSLGTGSPLSASALMAMVAAVRDELERVLFRRSTTVASQYPAAQLADPTPNVLVIGVDGTNLSRILADDENDNFFALMDDGTTAASSIVGHTTISNPSWTAILTGVWSERTGVINNVFTPWTYNEWPTVFNQLETLNPDIHTTAIADWNVINAIAGAGSIPADVNVYIPQIEGDTNWSQTDDAVGDATVAAIANTDPNDPSFLFTYFVGVDETGHLYGGASPEYAAAIRNVDDNLGEILDAIDAWETANPGEEWTIIVVTDHGHQPQKGFGHGFQSPDETSTFVIADGPYFNDGYINLQYQVVDTTPTVVTLFGGTPPAYSDGVSLTTLGASDVDPVHLRQALEDAIAMNGYPDIVTNVALSLRTIFGAIPYFVYNFTSGSTLLPIQILGDVLYVATNIPAQLVARLTGVTGASIFPLLPPPPPSWPTMELASVPNSASLACGGTSGSATESLCDVGNVA